MIGVRRDLARSGPRWSAGGHVLAATVVIVAFFAAAAVYTDLSAINSARHNGLKAARVQASTGAQAIAEGWAVVESQVVVLVTNPALPAALTNSNGCRLSFALDLLPTGHLDLMSPSGQVTCSSARLPAGGISQAAAPWVASLPRATGVILATPFRDAVTGQPAVAIVAPLIQRGRLLGAVAAVAPIGPLAVALDKTYGSTGRYVYNVVETTDHAVLSTSVPGGRVGPGASATPHGYLWGSAPVIGPGWAIYAGMPTSVALGPTRTVLWHEALLGALALLVILALLAIIRRRIAAPLRRLTNVVADSGPHVDTVLASVGGTAEVSMLANAIAEMREGRAAYEAQLAHQALHDPLTGLPNRALLADRLERAIELAAPGHRAVAVICVDVDRFKLVNETLGHTAGDQALTALGEHLAEVVPTGSTLARFGGDEFVIICEGLSIREVRNLADRLTAGVAAPIEVGGQVVRLSMSIGIAVAEPGSTAEGLLRDADAAMYQAKGHGGAHWELFNPQMRSTSAHRLTLETELRVALERGELHLLYQPKVDLSDGRINGVEALMRWNHPHLGSIPPTTFIPIAEETGLIAAIGMFALESACRQATVWREQGHDLTVSVNVSGRQLEDPLLVSHIAAILRKHDLPGSHLCLELTETALISEPVRAAISLGAVKELGVRISVDDFGTGYSSLAYLQRFPVNEAKIDRAFVNTLTDDETDYNLVAAIIAMGAALHLHVTAEGVETAAQADHLRRLGCDSAQGYLYSRPVPASAITELLVRDFNRVG